MIRILLAVSIALGFGALAIGEAAAAPCNQLGMLYKQMRRNSPSSAVGIYDQMMAQGCFGAPARVQRREAQPRLQARPRAAEQPRAAQRAARSAAQKPRTQRAARPQVEEKPARRTVREARQSAGAGKSRSGRTFRTYCVRSCDGYYFPVSFSTTKERFDEDEAACQAMCPAGEAGLYVHPTRSGPQDMVSLADARYVDLPTAFEYRTRLNPACSCGRPEISLAAINDPEEPATLATPALPVPRPPAGEDPETAADRAGAFALSARRAPALNVAGDRGPDGIRVVLDAWYVDNTGSASDEPSEAAAQRAAPLAAAVALWPPAALLPLAASIR